MAKIQKLILEDERFESLKNAPSHSTEQSFSKAVASSGFFYDSDSKSIKCFTCELSLNNVILEKEQIDVEHKKKSPNCSYIKNRKVDNTITREQVGYPIRHSRPIHGDYSSYEKRLQTYQYWPLGMAQSKQSMARAGFIYRESGDRVECFHCGIVLHNWDRDDVPVKEHYKWGPNCHYLYLMTGFEFDNDPRSGHASIKTAKCLVCEKNTSDRCYVPCGHVASCLSCVADMKTCPECYMKYDKTIRIYIN